MPITDSADLLQKVIGGDNVPTFSLDRLYKDGGNLFGWKDRLEQLFLDIASARQTKRILRLRSTAASAIRIGITHMCHARHERAEAPLLLNLGAGQRKRAHCPSVKAAKEADDVLPTGVVSGQFQRALDGLGPRVAKVEAVRTGHGRNGGETCGNSRHQVIVKIRPR